MGPKLTTIAKDVTDQYIIDAILNPTKQIKEGYETVKILTVGGGLITGLIADDTAGSIPTMARSTEQGFRVGRVPTAGKTVVYSDCGIAVNQFR